MSKGVDKLLEKMHQSPNGIRFAELCSVCDHFFGIARQTGGSHRVYKTPWLGDPRVNIQDERGKAKPYQVRQVLKAIEKLNSQN